MRNIDIADVTIVDAPQGLVVIDCAASVQASTQAMALFREHVADKPVAAVIYTHTHIDHYGGVKGVVSEADVASGKVPIVAPGTIGTFDKYAIGENVVAGNAMSRRAGYAFGSLLDHGPCGTITAGIGVAAPAGSIVSYISPTDSITRTGERRTLGGWEFEFLHAPDTEAPEEMHIWIPAIKALTCAENANHSLHNIQTLRGARTRDARNFARYLDETLVRHNLVFADPTDTEAKNLQADAYEQMGYQAEGPQWRGIFLTAARELREGVLPATIATAGPDTILAMPVDILFDFAAVHVIGPEAATVDLRMQFEFTDRGETWHAWVANGVLNARPGADDDAQIRVSGPKAAVVGVVLQPRAAGKLAEAGKVTISGGAGVLAAYAGVLDEFDPDFAVVTP